MQQNQLDTWIAAPIERVFDLARSIDVRCVSEKQGIHYEMDVVSYRVCPV